MAIKRPFRWNEDTNPESIKELNDTELEYLTWNFRKKFASHLLTGHTGAADYVAGSRDNRSGKVGNVLGYRNSATNPDANQFLLNGGHTVDSTNGFAEDKKKSLARNIQVETSPSSGDASDYPSDVTEFVFDQTLATQNTYRCLTRYRDTSGNYISEPNDTTFNNHGYFVWNSGGYVEIDNDVQNIVDTILKLANTEMLRGDEIGTYRVSESTPGSDWSQISSSTDQCFFKNTIMTYTANDPGVEGTNTTNKFLWLNTGGSFSGTTTNMEPFGWSQSLGNLQQKDIGHTTSNLINDVILPIYLGNGGSNYFHSTGKPGFPVYSIKDSSFSPNSDYEELRGDLTDSYYTDSTQRAVYGPLPGANGTYYKDRYGTGSLTTIVKNFVIHFGDHASYLR